MGPLSTLFLLFPWLTDLAWSTVIDFASPVEKLVMRTMFDRSPTFPTPPRATVHPRGTFLRRNVVTSPIIVYKQHSQVFRPQDGPLTFSAIKRAS